MTLKRKSFRQLCLAAIIFSLFQRSAMPGEVVDEDIEMGEEDPEFSRLRCPLCRWQPNASSEWECGDCGYPEYFYDACYAVWNTFTTRGRCPGCGHQWRWTSCLRCNGWSLHEDWYTNEK